MGPCNANLFIYLLFLQMTNAVKTGSGVCLISWNMKGMNNAIKIGKVLTQLQHLKGNVMFLQETHLKRSDMPRIMRAIMIE